MKIAAGWRLRSMDIWESAGREIQDVCRNFETDASRKLGMVVTK
jgi:hypothetical protein